MLALSFSCEFEPKFTGRIETRLGPDPDKRIVGFEPRPSNFECNVLTHGATFINANPSHIYLFHVKYTLM